MKKQLATLGPLSTGIELRTKSMAQELKNIEQKSKQSMAIAAQKRGSTALNHPHIDDSVLGGLGNNGKNTTISCPMGMISIRSPMGKRISSTVLPWQRGDDLLRAPQCRRA
jgi:hypothetical protein